MPLWIARHAFPAAWKRAPWKIIWLAAAWLFEKGRERVEHNLTKRERQELLRLIKKSKGVPSALPQRDRTRLKNIASKAIRG